MCWVHRVQIDSYKLSTDKERNNDLDQDTEHQAEQVKETIGENNLHQQIVEAGKGKKKTETRKHCQHIN